MEFRHFIADLPAFEDLAGADLDALAAAIHGEQHLSRYTFFTQGEPTQTMFLLRDGKVRVTRDDDHDQAIETNDLESGEIFGLLGLVGFVPATSTAVATGTVTVGCLTLDAYAELFAKAPVVAQRLQRMVAAQLARELQFRNRLLRARMRKDPIG